MFHCSVVKLLVRKEASFHFICMIRTKNFMRAISITVELMFPTKMLITNKNKDDIINISNCTLYIVKFCTGFDTLFLADFRRFSERGCQFLR